MPDPRIPSRPAGTGSTSRREFVAAAAAAAAFSSWSCVVPMGGAQNQEPKKGEPPFLISLAEWSLHRTLQRSADGKDNLTFPKRARAFGIDAVEYVNTFWKGMARDEDYLRELKKVCDGEGVQSVLIMCDAEGDLGDPDAAARAKAVENHHQWVDAAVALGCHSIRVNARSKGSWEEQHDLAVDGLSRLVDYGGAHGCNVIVENHGGLSSNGKWLAAVLKAVDSPRCGALPDFGNFTISASEKYDRYQGVAELMPFAKGVSAKSHGFDDQGEETGTDYHRMMKIVVDAGYHGRVGVEYEGESMSEDDGIRATKKLLERVREELATRKG